MSSGMRNRIRRKCYVNRMRRTVFRRVGRDKIPPTAGTRSGDEGFAGFEGVKRLRRDGSGGTCGSEGVTGNVAAFVG